MFGAAGGRDVRTLRFAAIVVAILTSCLAVLQVTGRIVVAQLADREDFLNEQLAAYRVQLSGVEGFWHGVNPGLRADRLVFPFGEFTDVVFEFDVIESAFYNSFIARVLQFDEATVAMERTPSGWQLLNQGPQPIAFDFPAFAMNSDIVVGHLRLLLHDGETVDEFTIDAAAINRQGRHRFSVKVTNPESCADCGIVAQGNIADLFDRSPGRGDPSFASLTVNDFDLRIAQFGDIPLRLDGDAAWHKGDDEGNGRLNLALTDARGEAFSVDGYLWEHDGGHRGHLGIAPADIPSDGIPPGNEGIADAPGQGMPAGDDAASVGFFVDGSGFSVWLSRLDLAPVLAVVRGNIGGDAPISEWLDNLRIGGVVENVRLLSDAEGTTVAASMREFGIDAYRGVPMLRGIAGTIVGQGGAFLVELADGPADGLANGPLTMAFPDLFDEAWPLRRASGHIEAWQEPGYLGLRSHDLVAITDDTRAKIGFAFARPDDLYEVRVAVDTVIDRTTVATAHTLIPNNLGPEIRDWLSQSMVSGDLGNARMVYNGYGRARPGEALNQVELTGSVRNGTIQYHPDWPTAFNVAGQFSVTAEGIFAAANTASIFDSDIGTIRISLPTGAATVGVKLKARADAGRVVEFGRIKPLGEALYFIDPSWSGEGGVVIDADLDIPITQNEDGTEPEGRYDIDFQLDGARLHLADLALDLRELGGRIEYRSPTTVTASRLTGSLFGHPMRADIATEERYIFDVEGTIGVADIYMLMGSEDLGIARGSTDFRARALLGGERPPTLEISDDLYGIELLAPPPIGKAFDDRVDFRATLEFHDEFSAASMHLDEAHGWMHAADSDILRGAFGIGASVPVSDENSHRVVVSGRLDALDLASTLEQGTTTNWQFNDLVIDRIDIGEFSIDAAIIDGFMDADEGRIQIASKEMDGVVSRMGEAPWQIALSEVRIPEESWDEDDESDPLSVDMIEDWIDADVVVERIFLGDEDYGSWRFSLRPGLAGAAFTDTAGELKGMDIRSDQPVFWDAATNETYFLGRMNSSDVAKVLREWDYSPSVESRSLKACGDLRWPGSPVNFALAHSSGHVAVLLNEGRFPTAEQGVGPMRILSLINFSAITKRMGFNFKDVLGEGVSFESLTADLSVDNGVVQFLEPMEIIGTGSHFFITGTVDMDSTDLDLRLVVTLPLHRSLPWYAAYLALATPTSAVGVLGVLVGEQIFGDQLEQLTSGLYHVRGTYEDPEVVFEGIFTNDMEVPNQVAAEGYPGAGGCSLDGLKPLEDPGEQTTPDSPQADAQPQASTEGSTASEEPGMPPEQPASSEKPQEPEESGAAENPGTPGESEVSGKPAEPEIPPRLAVPAESKTPAKPKSTDEPEAREKTESKNDPESKGGTEKPKTKGR